MGVRITPPKLARTLQDATASMRELWRELDNKPIIAGRLVDGSVASASSVLVTHGLPKAYRGAIVVGQSGTADIHVGRPADTDGATGGDSTQNIYVQFGATSTESFTLWVF